MFTPADEPPTARATTSELLGFVTAACDDLREQNTVLFAMLRARTGWSETELKARVSRAIVRKYARSGLCDSDFTPPSPPSSPSSR